MKKKLELKKIFLDLYHKLFPKPEEPVIDTLPKFKINDDIWVLGSDNSVDAGRIVDVVPGNRYVVYRTKYSEGRYDLFSEKVIAKRNGNECV